ncbi:MAG TPA: class I SAM-dependent methyltransferase [Sphingomicrobium sp.]|nr:class I SAM-dependent methyltransferase [Sphingomicrobium sp.]
MERAVFDRMAELDEHHWWFRARRRILEALIERVIRPPREARVLEVGCGTGHNLPMLAKFGSVEASELDPSARALAAKRLGARVLEAKLPDVSMFERNGYDLIALLDVLEHVPDDLGSLRAIHRRLKPGGALLLTVPANPWMWSAHDCAHHHFRRYTRRKLADLFLRSGLEVQLLSYFNSLLFAPIAAARIVGKISGKDGADDNLPGARTNAILETIFGLEATLLGRVRFPFGVSLVAVVRRPAIKDEP